MFYRNSFAKASISVALSITYLLTVTSPDKTTSLIALVKPVSFSRACTFSSIEGSVVGAFSTMVYTPSNTSICALFALHQTAASGGYVPLNVCQIL